MSGIHMLIDARQEWLFFVNGMKMGTSPWRKCSISAWVMSKILFISWHEVAWSCVFMCLALEKKERLSCFLLIFYVMLFFFFKTESLYLTCKLQSATNSNFSAHFLIWETGRGGECAIPILLSGYVQKWREKESSCGLNPFPTTSQNSPHVYKDHVFYGWLLISILKKD